MRTWLIPNQPGIGFTLCLWTMSPWTLLLHISPKSDVPWRDSFLRVPWWYSIEPFYDAAPYFMTGRKKRETLWKGFSQQNLRQLVVIIWPNFFLAVSHNIMRLGVEGLKDRAMPHSWVKMTVRRFLLPPPPKQSETQIPCGTLGEDIACELWALNAGDPEFISFQSFRAVLKHCFSFLLVAHVEFLRAILAQALFPCAVYHYAAIRSRFSPPPLYYWWTEPCLSASGCLLLTPRL